MDTGKGQNNLNKTLEKMAKAKAKKKDVAKRGRPKLKPENVRSKYVAIPLTAKEYRQLRAEAKSVGVLVTVYLRSKLLA